MKKIITTLFILLLCLPFSAAQGVDIVAKPQVEKLVNDFAGVISDEQAALLEDSLARYARRTSTQVLVITVSDLNGYEPADYAYRIGQTWGVGQKGKNNGVVILVKPKLSDTDKGRAFISSGYGLEGVLPDITCSRIVNNVMIPYFRNNDYQSGIIAGAIAVMKACEGEFDGDPEDAETGAEIGIFIFTVLVILMLLLASNNKEKKGGKKGKNSKMSNGGLFDSILLGSLLSNSNSNWGSFSSGSGSFSGGFGGFGGGSFGGGGGGGSW